MRKRILAALGALVIFCCSIFSVPASAATQIISWDWEDYVDSVEFVGDYKYVNITIPLKSTSPTPLWSWKVFAGYVGTGYPWIGNLGGKLVDSTTRSLRIELPFDFSNYGYSADLVSNGKFQITGYPFGEQYNSSIYCGLRCDNIPNGTKLAFSFDIDIVALGTLRVLQDNVSTFTVSYKSWDVTNGWTTLSSFTQDIGYWFESPSVEVITSKEIPVEFVVDKPVGAQYIDITLNRVDFYLEEDKTLEPEDGYQGVFTLTPSPISLTMELFVMQDLMDKLDANNQAMQQINDKLDDINDAINKPADPVTPSGSGQVDDYHQQEEQLMQGVSGGQSQVGDVQNNAAAGLTTYASGFAFMAATVNYFVDGISFISDLVWISLSLGTVAALLGIAMSAFRGRGDSADRSSGSTSKKE